MQKQINGAVFSRMAIGASKMLDLNREQIDTLFYIYKTHTNQIQSKTGWTNRLKHKKFRCLQYHEF